MCAIADTLLTRAPMAGHRPDSDFARAPGSNLKAKVSLATCAVAIVIARWLPLVARIRVVPGRRLAKAVA